MPETLFNSPSRSAIISKQATVLHETGYLNIVFFSHPAFLNSQSMPRYANWLLNGMKQRGHSVELLTADPFFYRMPVPVSMKKWMGYVDQYIRFPIYVKKRMDKFPANTLFVFLDHALGPWVPLVAHKPHVIHCHDFLAQLSSLGAVPENKTGWSGRQYQAMIRRGYSKGKNFISVSGKTQQDLHSLLDNEPDSSEIVYNGFTQDFAPLPAAESREKMSTLTSTNLDQGYLLHIGGNQWYKNRLGCLRIYESWRNKGGRVPLIMIGEQPSELLMDFYNQSPYKNDIHFLSNVKDPYLVVAYSGAAIFLFPSLAEGFGWPVAEAMACGCPVITTGEPPITEVAGDAAVLIPKMPLENIAAMNSWTGNAVDCINRVLTRNENEKKLAYESGLKNASRFYPEQILDRVEAIYRKINRGN